MNPNGVQLRESRDSEDHPESLPIIIALDVTGSMGAVPSLLVKDGLPNIMNFLFKNGIAHPQILFLGIGDHQCDNAPLQVGQFESNDELLDKWLTDIYLEGGGGGNDGESYLLAWYFAGYRTVHDSLEKRNQKGFLFTIGDEPTLENVPKETMKEIMGVGEYQNYSAEELLQKAEEKYNVYHIHIKETYSGSMNSTINKWEKLLSNNLIVCQKHTKIPEIVSNIIIEKTKGELNKDSSSSISNNDSEMML